MDERKLTNLKINLRIAVKIVGVLLFTVGAFLVAFYLGTAGDVEKSVYNSLGKGVGNEVAETLLPPPPFAENPPLSSMKK